MCVKFEGQKDKSPWHLLIWQGTREWRKLESNVATLRRPQTDMPGIPVGDYYPEIYRVNELPQVPLLPISYTEIVSHHPSAAFGLCKATLRKTVATSSQAPSLDNVHAGLVRVIENDQSLVLQAYQAHGLICYSVFLGKLKHMSR